MRYISPLREGGSLPALAEACDDFKYVIKFRGAGHGTKALISELLGGLIAKHLGLPVPEIVFVELDKAFGQTEADEEIFGKILTHCETMRWHPLFADIINKGTSKSRGIDEVIKHYGIKLEETMAFGDGGNDINMLEHAGIGVAMDNASDKVKAAADYITSSVDDNGIINALRHFNIL